MKRIQALLAAVLITAGLVKISAGRAEEGPDAEGTSAQSGKKSEARPPAPHPFARICERLGSTPAQTGGSCPDAECRVEFDWMIATVPDPDRTGLRLSFDRLLESIQRATEDSGYAFAGHWLPWRTTGDGDTAASCAGPLPGMLIFRSRQPARTRPLVVFLVGETPAAGIDAAMFRGAIALSRRSLAQPDVIRISGPTFSGSLRSLATEIQRHGGEFRVITGSATDRGSRTAFRERVEQFEAVVHDDQTVLQALVEFIESGWEQPQSIAIISEQQTDYGAQFQSSLGLPERTRVFRYPRDISRLRNVYRDPEQRAQPKGSAPATGTELQLKDSQAGADTLPQFSPQHTPASQEAVLSVLASTLRRERVRYAVLTASNPLDLLFLSRFLRRTCPDVRLILLNADLLFAHGSESYSFGGMMSASSYPLIAVNQHWSSRAGFEPARTIFPDSYSQGVYNATRLLLEGDGTNGLVEYGPPFEPGSAPPVWITAVGAGGYQPLSTSMPAQQDPLLHKAPAAASRTDWKLYAERPSTMWLALFIAATVASWLLILAGSESTGRGGRVFALFSPKVTENRGRVGRGVYLCALHIAMGCTMLLFTYPVAVLLIRAVGIEAGTGILLATGVAPVRIRNAFARIKRPEVRVWPLTVLGLLSLAAAFGLEVLLESTAGRQIPQWAFWLTLTGSATVLALGCSGVSTFLRLSVSRHPRRLEAIRRLFRSGYAWPAAAVFGIGLAVPVLLAWNESSPGHQSLFVAYRSLALTAGVSPLVPAIMLAGALVFWALIQLRRVAWHEDRCPVLPDMCGDVFCGRLYKLRDELEKTITRPFYSKADTAVTVAILLPVLALYPFWTGHQSLEHQSLETMFVLLTLAVTILCVLTLYRFLTVSTIFREFLQCLERHPLRTAFTELRGAASWSPIWQGGGRRRSHVVITRSLENLRRLAAAQEPSADWRAIAADLEAEVADLIEITSSRRRVPAVMYNRIQHKLAAAGTLAADALRSYWDKGKVAPDGEADGPREHRTTLLHHYLALRFLPYMTYVQLQMQNLLLCVSVLFVLSLMALDSYPFRSQEKLGWIWVLFFGAYGAGVVTVFARMSRDPILSRIAGTEAGKLDSGFVRRVLVYGTLPLLSVLASHMPGVSGWLYTWLVPTLEALR